MRRGDAQVTGLPADANPGELTRHFAAVTDSPIADCVVAGDNRRLIANWVRRGDYVRSLEVRSPDACDVL